MQLIRLPELGTAEAWRTAARDLARRGVRPDQVLWQHGTTASGDLFAQGDAVGAEGDALRSSDPDRSGAAFTVPRGFVALADEAICHSDPERFGLLYAILCRLIRAPALLTDRADPQIDRLNQLAKSVRRDMHKMKAFVRFRDIGAEGEARRRFVSWFEPEHYIVEATAPFFARRFADMDWAILTPKGCAHFDQAGLRFAGPAERPHLPDDAAEELWTTYFRNIFNPARLKVKAMQSEMPRKYWKNMPEAAAIPDMIAGAEARVRKMQAAAPTLPPLRAEKILARAAATPAPKAAPGTIDAIRDGANGCRRCLLHAQATQAVPGEGPLDAALMIVGEQPGDQEDLAGRPFVGPAGRLFDEAADRAGLDREAAFVTNAVKHFKFTPRGKRRIHQRPDRDEISACHWWLDAERQLIKPRLILGLGATAALALTGNGDRIQSRRGQLESTGDGTPVFLTVHPAFLLRLPDRSERARQMDLFVDDLRAANAELAARIDGDVRPGTR